MTLVGRKLVLAFPFLAAAILAGCQLTPAPGLMACPLPATEQAVRVVEVVPLGTPREDVLKRLKDAGIRGNFGENQSIFYCDVWNREDGERWHINVVLLFNEQGELYATRPDASTAGPSKPTDVSPSVDPFQ
jgi:hypothetical protein